MWAGQEVRGALELNPTITNNQPKPLDNASTWGIERYRYAEISDDSLNQAVAKKPSKAKANTGHLGERGLMKWAEVRRDLEGWKEVKWNSHVKENEH